MRPRISHSRDEETPEAKARWFQSLTIDERAQVFDEFMSLILEANPGLLKKKEIDYPGRQVRVLRVEDVK